MKQFYDWMFLDAGGETYKFFHTDMEMTTDQIMNVVRATEMSAHPGCAVVFLDDQAAEYDTTLICDRVYHLVPFTAIERVWAVAKNKEVERLKLFDVIKGECGEV